MAGSQLVQARVVYPRRGAVSGWNDQSGAFTKAGILLVQVKVVLIGVSKKCTALSCSDQS